MKKTLNVAVIGGGFMGKAHSNGWQRVGEFFDVPFKPVLKIMADKSKNANLEQFQERWGYEEITYDWTEILERDDIDIIDICTPTFVHKEMVIAAAKAGKHVVCEKPLTVSYADALEMLEACKEAGVVHYLNHNYRRVPAVAMAKKMVEEGKLGRIFHWRGAYLQDWITDPNFPLAWQLQKELAGGGPLFDLSSHAVDLARYIIGEPAAVTAVNKTFIKERPLPGIGATAFTAGTGTDMSKMGTVDVDDASFAVIEFENGVLGTVESSRFATGCKNYNYFEIYGEKGSIRFNLERMNELEYLDATRPAGEQGFATLPATEAAFPYASTWWPSGHIIGYEHTFVHAFRDVLLAIDGQDVVTPNFEDGAKIIRILTAIQKSSDEQRRVTIDEIV